MVARGGWRRSTVEMNSISWSPVLQYATPLPMNRTPVSTVALQHKSVSSVLRYATPPPDQQDPRFDRRRSVSSVLRYARPLPMNRIPFRTWSVEHKAVSSVLWYARPRFHCMFHPSPPDEHDHAFHSDPAGWLPRVPLPPDEHDAFRCLPMNTTHSVASP